MARAQLESRPRVPKSLKDLDKVLRRGARCRKLAKTLDGTDNVYAGRAGGAREKTLCLLFISRRMHKVLRKAKRVFADGTFAPVPRDLRSSQIWTISQVRRHHVSGCRNGRNELVCLKPTV